MARFNELELGMLQQALDSGLEGIDAPGDQSSAEYEAHERLVAAGLLEEGTNWKVMGSVGPRRIGCKITEDGREVLDELRHGEDLALGVEEGRTIIVLILNLCGEAKMMTPDQVAAATEATRTASPGQVRSIMERFGGKAAEVASSELTKFLIQALGSGG